jgi:hypothetical protein
MSSCTAARRGAARLAPGPQESYLRRTKALPEQARQVMLLAAADPTGDATLLWRAARGLSIGRDAAAIARSEELLEIAAAVPFRHPLVRSASCAASTPEHRSAAHLALAGATDAQDDPDRRAWHLAAAATGPQEDVTTELGQTAGKAMARAGLTAAATFLQRADDPQRARIEQLTGQVEAAARPAGEAAARRRGSGPAAACRDAAGVTRPAGREVRSGTRRHWPTSP